MAGALGRAETGEDSEDTEGWKQRGLSGMRVGLEDRTRQRRDVALGIMLLSLRLVWAVTWSWELGEHKYGSFNGLF